MSRRGWSEKQDLAVKALVQKLGTKNWSALANELHHIYKFKERTGKQCRQRYHNHLDPKIQKKIWTEKEETILFKMHKVYGNKWTSIAEHLEGRTDNTIKNHFYSTIRRSLRRMSKLIGSKNSTKQMKYIKPSTLSKIFAINIRPSTIEQIEQQKKKCSQNKVYEQLVNYIKQNCSDLTDIILEFSNFKPKGKDCVLPQQQRGTFQNVIQKLIVLNQIYEKMRKQQKKLSINFHLNEDESSSSSSSQQETQKIVKTPKITRSQREIKPPKKFQQKLLKPIKKEKKATLIKRSSSRIQQRVKNQKYQFFQMKKIQSQKQGDLSLSFDHFKESHIQINLKQKDQNDAQFNNVFQIGSTPMAYTPNYFFGTPNLAFQSPNNINLSATSQGDLFLPRLSQNWSINPCQLDDIVNKTMLKIAKNQQNQGKEDGKTSSSSNINCSPNSAFKSVQ